MKFMEWSPKFELGIPDIDKQHQRWLEILNNFYEKMDNNEMTENLKILIGEVLEYTNYHFKEEETFMDSIHYPEIESHKKRHIDVINTIQEYQKKAETGKIIISMTLTSELKNWFKEHILIEDKKYSDFYLK